MPAPDKRTQKDIALTYGGSAPNFSDGRLDYFRRGHWFRRFRLVLFLFVVIGSIGGVIAYSFFVGPTARRAWNKDLRERVAEAVKKGEPVAPPWNAEELFNTGEISENHQRLEGGCQACHWGSEPNVTALIGLGRALEKMPPAGDNTTFGKLGQAWKEEGTKGLLAAYNGLNQLQKMDAACIRCHVDFQQLPVSLHLPQSPQLHLAKVSFPFSVADAGTCSSCHKEHVGNHRMAEVSSDTCGQCHAKSDGKGNSEILNILKNPHRGGVINPAGAQQVGQSTTAQVGEGITRFLVTRTPGDNTGFSALWNKPFRFYGPENPRDKNGPGYEGHPPFRYELPTARDPALIKYNHAAHEQAKVMNLFNKEFEKETAEVAGLPIREWINKDGSQNCLFCHEPGSDGEYRQQINFDRHCRNCHRMDIVVPPLQTSTGQQYPFVARINIPHRDPEKVRAFLDQQSLLVELDRAALNAGYKDQAQRREYVVAAFTSLKNRGIENPLELLKRVFYTGDPAYESWRAAPTTNKALAACSLCHKDQLSPPSEKDYFDIARAPGMAPTGIAHRWANHGPFTHEPHKHMTCADCHANTDPVIDPRTMKPVPSPDSTQPGKPMTYSVKSAHESRITADILMPRQRLCAECHRPMPNEAAAELAAAGGPTSSTDARVQSPAVKTKWQRATGGIKYECLDCHKFHAPAEALPFIEQLQKADAAPGKKQAAAK